MPPSVKALFRLLVVALLAVLAACNERPGSRPPAPRDGGAPAAVARAGADAAVPAAAAPAWQLGTRAVPVDCGEAPEPAGSYDAALARGRASAKARRWGEAVAAFRRALEMRKDDGAALSELALASLHAGDAAGAAEAAERAVGAARVPKLQAASHYNAGRAAEALGDVARARDHYEKSIALRASPVVSARLGALAPAPARSLERGSPLATCRELPSFDAVCGCLARSLGTWGTELGLAGPGTCEPAKQRGSTAQMAIVGTAPADPRAVAAGAALVLVVRRGASWSAAQVVDAAPDVDLDETPRASHGAELVSYEERPRPDGALIWVQSQNEFSETSLGEEEVEGHAALTMCLVPTAADAAIDCRAPVSLGQWDYTFAASRDEEEEDRCDVRAAVSYGLRLESSGRLFIVLDRGVDQAGRSGRYQL